MIQTFSKRALSYKTRREQIPTQRRVGTHTCNRYKNTSSSVRHGRPRLGDRATSTMTLEMRCNVAQRSELPRAAVTSPEECTALLRQSKTVAVLPRRGDGRRANILRDDFAREVRTQRTRTRSDSPAREMIPTQQH